jgi:integron integrase
MAAKPRLLDQVREKIRLKHYSIRTEQAYVDWIKRFILFHDKRHPENMGKEDVEKFLTHLAVERHVAASTQNQALSAILFLYQEVLGHELPWLDGVERAKRPARLPVVLTASEVRSVLARLDGIHGLMASLLYGTGLRLMECVRLRVKDIDFEYGQITVRDGKGEKDRITMVPGSLGERLKAHLEKTKTIHEQDLREGFGEVYLPYALARKYPNAGREWGWQYVFPASKRSIDPRSGKERRHHTDEQNLQRAMKRAVREAAIHKPASCHSLRHNPECPVMPSDLLASM